MKTRLLAGCAVAGAAIALSGCASTSGSPSDLLQQLDGNFAGCDRHITFQAGLGVVTPGAQVSGSVDCKSAPVAAPSAREPARPAP